MKKNCKYGDRCRFAHSKEELRPPQRPTMQRDPYRVWTPPYSSSSYYGRPPFADSRPGFPEDRRPPGPPGPPGPRYPPDRYPPDRYPPDRYPPDRYPPERYPLDPYPPNRPLYNDNYYYNNGPSSSYPVQPPPPPPILESSAALPAPTFDDEPFQSPSTEPPPPLFDDVPELNNQPPSSLGPYPNEYGNALDPPNGYFSSDRFDSPPSIRVVQTIPLQSNDTLEVIEVANELPYVSAIDYRVNTKKNIRDHFNSLLEQLNS